MVDKVISRPRVKEMDPHKLYITGIFQYGKYFIHNKEVYTLIDCLGDLGGLIEIIMFISALIMTPISFHSYIIKAISKLYTARTKDDKVFLPPKQILKGDNIDKQIQITALLGSFFRLKASD